MDCARARFLLYAYLDREFSPFEGEALSRHLTGCGACAQRAQSARRLAGLLRSHLDRTPAPTSLRARLRGEPPPLAVRPRLPFFAAAAGLLVMVLPFVSDVAPREQPVVEAGLIARRPATHRRVPVPVSRRLTGTFVCLDCEARSEAGLCPLPHARHEEGFCTDNGELWRLMPRDFDAEAIRASLGRTATVEGVAFPESGFLRVSRVGY